jgi:hypothetical protein
MDVQHVLHEQLEKLNSIVPPHILVPALIGILTVITAMVQVSRSIEKDIYDAPEKHVLKVEEVYEDLQLVDSVIQV